jgi:hypothetical protein
VQCDPATCMYSVRALMVAADQSMDGSRSVGWFECCCRETSVYISCCCHNHGTHVFCAAPMTGAVCVSTRSRTLPVLPSFLSKAKGPTTNHSWTSAWAQAYIASPCNHDNEVDYFRPKAQRMQIRIQSNGCRIRL